MQNLLEDLRLLLTKDQRFVIDGKLLKNKVIECALNLDADLINLLLQNDTIKKHFFQPVGEVLVFDKVKFQKFVSNKQFLPDSYTAFKNKIGLISGDEFIADKKEVVLAWPYKDCVLEGGQTKEDQKRSEIFWSETLAPEEIDRLLAPKVFTNFKRFSKDSQEEVTNLSNNENFIIKGNNLLALHSLARIKAFKGKVKIIYIDPPYNTGSDGFNYNDNFNHSTWLTFMKNRLEIAYQLLSIDGCMYVHCDDNEQAYLKVLMDQIFGAENFIANIIRVGKAGSGHDSKYIAIEYDYVLFYCKDNKQFKTNKAVVDVANDTKYKLSDEYENRRGKYYLRDLDYKGSYSESLDYPIVLSNGKALYSGGRFGRPNTWRWSKQKFEWGKENGFIVIDEEREKVYIKQYQFVDNEDVLRDRFLPYRAFTTNLNSEGAKEIQQLFNNKIFDYPKPESIIEYLLNISSNEGDLVLDYHLGSGTTAAVAHKMKRRYIGIEQMDYIESIAVERMKKVIDGEQGGVSISNKWNGGGSFVYCELLELNQKYVRLIQSEVSKEKLLTVWSSVISKNIHWSIEIEDNLVFVNELLKLEIDSIKRILIEMIDKNILYIPYSEINDIENKISNTEKLINRQLYANN